MKTMKTTVSDKMCKHKFEPRYHSEYTTKIADCLASTDAKFDINCYASGGEVFLKKQTYIWDICPKCGQTRRLGS
jgi:ribosomal protein L37AE/L43A